MQSVDEIQGSRSLNCCVNVKKRQRLFDREENKKCFIIYFI